MKQLMELIENELNWCAENPDPSLSLDYQKGFVKGLRQAQYLINTWAKATREGVAGTNLSRDEIRFLGLDLEMNNTELKRFADCWNGAKKKKSSN